MDAAKALENIKEALDSGMGPLPTLAMIRETVAEMYPPASPATAPPSDLPTVAAQASQGKSAAPYLKLKAGEQAKLTFGDMLGQNAAFYKKYIAHDPSKFEGYKPVGVTYDEMPHWEKEMLAEAPDFQVPDPSQPLTVQVLPNGQCFPYIPAQQRTAKINEQLQQAHALALKNGHPVNVSLFVPTKAELDALAKTEALSKMTASTQIMSEMFKQMGATFTATIKPEQTALWKTLLGEKPDSPNV